MTWTLQPLTFAEIPEIAELEKECFPSPWAEGDYFVQFEVEGTSGFGLWEAGRLIAALVYTPDGDEDIYYIVSLAVRSGYRRLGAATRLLGAMIALGKPLTLHARAGDPAARRLYRGVGFSEVRTEPGFYDDNGDDAVLMLRV